MIERKLNGEIFDERIVPVAACNPYQLRERNINTKSAGLSSDTIIGIRQARVATSLQMVYTVNPLPESMFNFVWNYDKLKGSDEKDYITRIVESENDKRNSIFSPNFVRTTITEAVNESHIFIRKRHFLWSVSLRDIKRF